MIISKQNLQAVHVTKVDKSVPALDNVHIAKDGSTAGIGGKMVVVVSPVEGEIKDKITNILPEKGKGGLTISADTVRHILKDMPADRQFKGLLEHCNVERLEGNECRITLTDGKRRRNVVGKVYRREFLPYEKVIKTAMETCSTTGGKRIVLNLKRMLLLLSTIEKVAPDTSGDSPVWIEFTDQNYIIIRGINMVTGQRTIGVMTPYEGAEGKWLDPNDWELSFLDKPKILKTKKKIKHKKRKRLTLKRK